MYGISDTNTSGTIDRRCNEAVSKIPMKYYAAQFRAARAALRLDTRTIAAELNWSLRTVGEIEHSDEEGARAPREAAFGKLAAFYERRGVTFLANTAQGIGIRLRTR